MDKFDEEANPKSSSSGNMNVVNCITSWIALQSFWLLLRKMNSKATVLSDVKDFNLVLKQISQKAKTANATFKGFTLHK